MAAVVMKLPTTAEVGLPSQLVSVCGGWRYLSLLLGNLFDVESVCC